MRTFLLLLSCLSFAQSLVRVELRRLPSVWSQLRASNQLDEFLREHQPDVFSHRYVQCFPPAINYLHLGGKFTKRLHGSMHHKLKAFESSWYTHDGCVFGIDYGSGHLLGVMAREQLKIGSVMVQNQVFGKAMYEASFAFLMAQYDGILGFGFLQLAEELGSPVVDGTENTG